MEWRDDGEAPAETGVWRYAYDRHQRRVRAQHGARSQQRETTGHTRPTRFAPGCHRALPSSQHPATGPAAGLAADRAREAVSAAAHDAAGQPRHLGSRSLHWVALGRLTVLLAPLAVAPVFTGLGAMIYGAIAVLGGAFFVFLATRVLRSRSGEGAPAEDKRARDLFGFSILYLFALFAALLAERGFA